MYKLFLTLRYLTRKKIVIFPILVVWLCLMMMIIVTSIMGGFVDRVRQANRDLLGDIIVSSPGNPVGWSGYDDLRKFLADKFPEIQASTPVVHAAGLAYFPEYNQTIVVQVVGIRPAERAKVSRFRETLYRQYILPNEVADILAPALPASRDQLVAYAEKNAQTAVENFRNAQKIQNDLLDKPTKPAPNFQALWGLIPLALLIFLLIRPRLSRTIWSLVWACVILLVGLLLMGFFLFYPILFPHQLQIADDRTMQAFQAYGQANRVANFAHALPLRQYHSKQDLLSVILPPEPGFNLSSPATSSAPASQTPEQAPSENGCIVGIQLGGIFPRDRRGNFDRSRTPAFLRTQITVFPVKDKGMMSATSGFTLPFTVVDDSYTGVYDVDSTYIYAPFETIQYMARMRPDPDIVKDNPAADYPPRCHDLLIKLKEPTTANQTQILRAKLQDAVDEYQGARGEPPFYPLLVQTWDERQAKYLGAVENEKWMQVFILGLMSLVVLVVIFLIFYMIVRDKIRDIGILKAVGGSELGVLAIFLNYGFFIGVVGGGLGVLSGVAFVTHTNEIHEWIYQVTGITIWDRSVYLFDRIPDIVNYTVLTVYYIVAIVAGLLGAAIPATFAALEDPVKAVRYE